MLFFYKEMRLMAKSRSKRTCDTLVKRGSWRTPKITWDEHNRPVGLHPETPKPPVAEHPKPSKFKHTPEDA